MHNLKNNLLNLPNLQIVWLSQTYARKIHDKHICDKEILSLPKGIRLWQDGGFLRHKPLNAEIKCRYENQEENLCQTYKKQKKTKRSAHFV